MHFGVTMFAADFAIRVDELARAAEDRGLTSLWLPEHTHIPASRRSPWPGGPELPREYWHTHDLFVSLAVAAAVTRRLKVCTGICLLVERDPITTAKEVASLDFLSEGRVMFGIGGGWNAEEMENHGTSFATRWALLRERVAAMKQIWTADAAEYHGKFVDFDPIWSWPKPVQKPHPPIFLGGHTADALQRVVDYCDGWLPIPGRAADLAGSIEELHRRAEKEGRDPRSIAVATYGSAIDAAVAEQFRGAGVDHYIFGLPAATRETILPLLDRCAAVAREVGT